MREYVFGKSAPGRPVTAGRAAALLAGARRAAAALREARTERLVDALARAGRMWADPSLPARVEAKRRLAETVGFSGPMLDLGFETVAGMLTRETLLARLRGELRTGRPHALLDGFAAAEHFAGVERACPLGVVVNVSPGNVFVSAADAIASALVTKNALIFKTSAEDPHFPALFAETLRAADGGGPLSSALAVVSWRGGDAEVEPVLKAGADGVVVWGGEAAVAAWRAGLPASARLIEYGPKLSFAVLDLSACRSAAGLERLATGLARDISIWDGHACSSPQTLFVVPSRRFGAADLREALAVALEEFAYGVPPGDLSLDEKVEILRARERGRVAAAEGRGGVSGDGTAGLVVDDGRRELLVSCKNRVVHLVPVGSAAEAAALAAAHRGYLQAAALFGQEKSRARDAATLAFAGVNRVTHPGRMSAPDAGAPHDGKHFLSELVRFVTLENEIGIQGSPALGGGAGAAPPREPGGAPPRTPPEGRGPSGPPDPPLARLRALLAHAKAHSPFYRVRLKRVVPETATFADLARVPPVDRAECAANSPPASRALLTARPAAAAAFASGGSKGAPKYAYYAADEFERATDALAFIYRMAGLAPGDTVGNLFIAGSLWTSFLVAHRAIDKVGAVNLPVAGNPSADEILDHLLALGCDALVGLPSILLRVAETAERRGVKLRIRKILYGGEHLYPDAIAYLKRVLGARLVRSAGYATVDCGPIGWQCAGLSGTLHHVLEGHQHVEILRPDGTPAGTGETGELVATNLDRRLQPAIRFRTGDLGRWERARCRCGSDAPVFRLLGRADDMLVIGGMNLAPGDVAEAVAGLPGLTSAFSLEADTEGSKERLTVLLESTARGAKARRTIEREAGRRFSDPKHRIGAALRSGWLAALVVRAVPPDALPRNPRTGKVVTVVDRRRIKIR